MANHFYYSISETDKPEPLDRQIYGNKTAATHDARALALSKGHAILWERVVAPAKSDWYIIARMNRTGE